MPLPSVPQTFALEGCRNMLRKLDWEIAILKAVPTDDPEVVAFHAFNGAVTAWHIADWVWRDMKQEMQRAQGLAGLSDLQKRVRTECRALYLCRQIATASKHAMVLNHYDPAVETTVSADVVMAPMGSMLKLDRNVEWSAKIIDGEKRLAVVDVLEQASEYWTRFIYLQGIDSTP